MSLEDEKTDQFKLVSIEGNSIKSTANKAKQAYNSYLKEDEFSEDGDFSEEPVMEVQEEVKPPQKSKTQNLAKKGTAQLNKTSTSQLNKPVNKSGKKYDVDDDDDDNVLFNEDGSINDGDDVKNNIEELKKSVSDLIGGFFGTISALGVKLLSLAMKPISIVIGILTKILNIPLSILNKIIGSLASKLDKKKKELQPEEEPVTIEEPVLDIKKAVFSEMIELNIMFIDNYKKNLYTQPKSMAFKLSRAEEDLIMSMTIEAIRECAEFTAELPPPVEGIYEGIPVSKIMDEVTEEDVKIFLGFVKSFPGKYIGKSWKISETFATWLINNSPTG